MKHNQYNPDFKFFKDPVEFNKFTDKELLQYCLGGTLYMPGTKDVLHKILAKEMQVSSMVMCFEDAIEENVLSHLDAIYHKRKALAEAYDWGLQEISHFTPKWYPGADLNYAYYPIVLENEDTLLKIKSKLEENQIQTRRYFYPSLADALPYLQHTRMPITGDIARRVLCLPLYYDLEVEEVERITKILTNG